MFYLSWTCTKVGPSGCEGVFGVSCNISKDLVKMARNACDRKKNLGEGEREREIAWEPELKTMVQTI